jgi:hypothetical protein
VAFPEAMRRRLSHNIGYHSRFCTKPKRTPASLLRNPSYKSHQVLKKFDASAALAKTNQDTAP